MIRNADFRGNGQQLENMSTGQLFDLFESYHTTKTAAVPYTKLAEAWGLLFSSLYLSAEELIDGMQKGEHLLGEEKEKILREFVQADCKGSGIFVLEVIQKGGNMDRAALIMMARLEDLGSFVYRNTTALHMLADVCDKKMRPVFIKKAGKKALAEFFDIRGLPVLFTILALNDMRKEDLKAIGQIYSREELRNVKKKDRTGKSMLEVYTEASLRLDGRPPGERNAFAIHHAEKSTNMRRALKSQLRKGPQRPGTDVMGESAGDETDIVNRGNHVQFRSLLSNPLDELGKIHPRKTGRK